MSLSEISRVAAPHTIIWGCKGHFGGMSMSSENISAFVNIQISEYENKLRHVSRDTSHNGYVLMMEYNGAIKALRHLLNHIESDRDTF